MRKPSFDESGDFSVTYHLRLPERIRPGSGHPTHSNAGRRNVRRAASGGHRPRKIRPRSGSRSLSLLRAGCKAAYCAPTCSRRTGRSAPSRTHGSWGDILTPQALVSRPSERHPYISFNRLVVPSAASQTAIHGAQVANHKADDAQESGNEDPQRTGSQAAHRCDCCRSWAGSRLPVLQLRQGAIRLCRNQCGQRVQVRLEHAAPVVSLDARRDLAGTVKLTKRGHNGPLMTRFHHCSAGTRHRIPDAERARSQQAVVNGSEQVASHTKEVLHETMHR